MKKSTIERFGNTYFLLGIRQDGAKVYMQDFRWDCGWYWAGGCLTIIGRNDISEHYHLDGIMENINFYGGMKRHFKDIVLTDVELWQFCDLMASFYTLKESAEVLLRGGSHYTKGMLAPNTDMSDKINNEILKNELIPLVRKLLGE